MLKSKYPCKQKGFSLLELALVLFVMALVLGGMLNPIGSLMEGRQRAETRRELERIREALMGFAMINGYLPCPATTADPGSADYGIQDATCHVDPVAEGYLPWRTLGVHPVDPWGVPRTAATDPFNGHWRYRVDRNFSQAAAPFTLATHQGENITIQDFQNRLLTATTEQPVAVIYSTGANLKPDGENATFEGAACGNPTGYDPGRGCPHGGPLYQGGGPQGAGGGAGFDDITLWISRPLLFNRMVLAGRLP